MFWILDFCGFCALFAPAKTVANMHAENKLTEYSKN
jgi:hypothetical protein